MRFVRRKISIILECTKPLFFFSLCVYNFLVYFTSNRSIHGSIGNISGRNMLARSLQLPGFPPGSLEIKENQRRFFKDQINAL